MAHPLVASADDVDDRARFERGLAHAIEDAFHRIARRGEGLGVPDLLRPLVKGDQIGKRASDVDRDP